MVAECPICATSLAAPRETVSWTGFECARCGRWSINLDAGGIEYSFTRQVGQWDTLAVRRRSWLSHTLRRLQPGTGAYRWADLPVAYLDSSYLDRQPMPSPAEQLDNLILAIGDQQPSIAESALISVPATSAWIGATIIRHSPGAALGWLLSVDSSQALFEDNGEVNAQKRLRLRMPGWDRYEQLKRGRVQSRRVIMDE
jgi:hypothetical protein